MQHNLLVYIIDYIAILKRDYNLQVSFSYTHFPVSAINYISPHVFHENSLCACIKKHGMCHCIKNKDYLISKNFKEPFFGKCYAGIEEYVFPVTFNDKTVNFISVSGYRNAISVEPNFKKLSHRSLVEEEKLKKEYYNLNTEIPELNKISPLIYPLVLMLELFHEKILISSITNSTNSKEDETYKSILNYIAENFRNNLTINDICVFCHYSQTYICNLFKRKSKKTITQYIIELKMEESAKLLIETKKSISTIAYETGFNDSNYFTNQFKKYYKISPKLYRKKNSHLS